MSPIKTSDQDASDQDAPTAEERAALEEKLRERIGRLDHRAIDAALTILEILAHCDHRRATRLIDAIAMFITFGPHTASRARRRRTR